MELRSEDFYSQYVYYQNSLASQQNYTKVEL